MRRWATQTTYFMHQVIYGALNNNNDEQEMFLRGFVGDSRVHSRFFSVTPSWSTERFL